MLSARVGDLTIAYRNEGTGDPVLLINGTGETASTWSGLIDVLHRHFRTVAYDARDCGESSYVEAPYTPRDLAADAAGLIEALSLGPCHVVGYSLGGATAQELALARPDLVRSLVLLSTWDGSDAWFVSQMRNWQSIRRAHWDDDRAFSEAMEAWLFSPATMQDEALVRRIHRLWAAEVPQRPDGWVRQCEADIAHDAAGRLDAIAVPVLVVVGEDDICTPLRYARALVKQLPDARLVTIPDGGHCVLFERPDEVARAIASFLREQ